MNMLAPGSPAPQFTLKNQSGNSVSLNQFLGKWVVVYFYPRAMTPGCTVQACHIRDSRSEFKELGAVVLGISPDKPAALKKFEERDGLNFTLLADEGHKIAEMFGVWVEKSLYGKRYMGVERATFLINPEGLVVHTIPKASPKTHHEDIINYLKNNI